MILLALLGGVLAIASPCVLPIVPFLFARADRSLWSATVPMLAGLALTFAAIISVATVSATWIGTASGPGRAAALVILALAGLGLLAPALATFVARPFVSLGARLDRWATRSPAGERGEVGRNAVIGVALGLLWAPCAGPILGLVVATAALGGSQLRVSVLALSFALGAVSTLAIVMAMTGRALASVRRVVGADAWVRRALGVITLSGVLVIAAGWDRPLYASALGPTNRVEQRLLDAFGARSPTRDDTLDIGLPVEAAVPHMALEDRGDIPDFSGGGPWINSEPIAPAALRGKVVLVWFWTFQCYNCLNALPHVKELEAKYRDQGLVVIGVHTPELPQERVESNVRDAVRDLGIPFPVVIDGQYKIWNRWHNQYWPAAYYADQSGRIRFHHFGEGSYAEQDSVVAQLLAAAR